MEIILNKITIDVVLVLFCIVVTLVMLFQKNSNFLDIRTIIKNHVNVFSSCPLQFTVIFVVPLILSYVVVNEQTLTKDIVENLNIVLSILISMFFAMLSILAAFNYKPIDKTASADPSKNRGNEVYNKLLKETFNAVMFECLSCIVTLIISFTLLFIDSFTASWKLIIASYVVYYLSLVMVFNIFVIIKRLKELFNNK